MGEVAGEAVSQDPGSGLSPNQQVKAPLVKGGVCQEIEH
jgi:hypothetical protein